jgi:hypothetical protein
VSASRNAISGADVATGKLVESLLSDLVKGTNAFDVPGAHIFMLRKIRNLGRPGIASMAIFKMKIGRKSAADFDRVRAAREAIGPLVERMSMENHLDLFWRKTLLPR